MNEDPRWPRESRPQEPADWSGWDAEPPPPRAPYTPANQPPTPEWPAEPYASPPPGAWSNQGYSPPAYPQQGYPAQRYAPGYGEPRGHEPAERVVVHERDRRRSPGWSLPIEHIVLGVGVASLWFALTQPWGTDAGGHAVTLAPLAARIATYVAGANVALGGLLILLNKRLGCLALIGCLGLFGMALLAAATVGGFTFLTQIHVMPQVTMANIKSNDRGFFLWWGGMAVIVVGLLLQLITHRRKGLIGI